jgi:glycosyltransferase involved in cell wall biosynthesis
MKVLYIDGDGPLGGASRSLFEVVRPLSQGRVEPYFVAARGTALEFYRQIAKDIVEVRGLTRLDNTRYSYYRGIRWLILLREIFHFPFTIAGLLKAKRRWPQVDVIHVNEVLFIVPALIAKRLFRVPLVVHVRSLARVNDRSFRSRWFNRVLRRKADAVIAINGNTRATLAADIAVDIIQNSFTPEVLPEADHRIIAKISRLRPGSLKVGFVGNLHVSKGVFDLVEAAKLVKKAGRDVDFLFIGGITSSDKGWKARLLNWAGLSQNVRDHLKDQIQSPEISDIIHLLGPTLDIQSVYERIDVIAFPSHFDAPGRPVFEAAFSAVPSIVAVTTPQPDTLRHGETGLAIAAKDPQGLADAIIYFADNRAEVIRMGANAKALAELNCNPLSNAEKLLEVYRRVACKGTGHFAETIDAVHSDQRTSGNDR